MTKPDIMERLVDFDRWGLTATERFEMRMEAYEEIKRLRIEVQRQRERRKSEDTVKAIAAIAQR